MLKKIVLGTVFVVFIGALITGAIIRTMDKSEQTAANTGSGGGNGRNASLETAEISGGQGNGQGNGRSGNEGNVADGQSRGRGGNSGDGPELLAEENSDHLWDVFSGSAVDVSEAALTIETNDGESIIVDGRAWSFAQELGFTVGEKDQVRLEGFYEDGEFKASLIENLTTGDSVTLREASGRPAWAGGGKGNL